MPIRDLAPDDRLRLLRFVCSLAWADLEVQDAERDFVKRMLATLDVDDDEAAQVQRWLEVPPAPEDVDPTDVPLEHRQVFLNALLQVVGADGVVDSKEMETLALFERLVRPETDDENTP